MLPHTDTRTKKCLFLYFLAYKAFLYKKFTKNLSKDDLSCSYRVKPYLFVRMRPPVHVDSVPDNHRIGQQIQAPCLIGLPFLIVLTHHSFAGKEEELPEIMELLTFVELGMNTLPQGVIFQVTQDKDGFDKPPVLLEQFGSLPLSRVGLQSTDQKRRSDIAAFERACHSCEVVPSLEQSGEIDPANQPCSEPRIDRGIGFQFVKLPLTDIP